MNKHLRRIFILFGVVVVSLLSSVSYAKTYGRLRVKVVIKESGKPVKDLGVNLVKIESGKTYEKKTNDNGEVVFEKLVAERGKYMVLVGFLNRKGTIMAYIPERYKYYVSIEKGKETYLEVKMVIGGVLTGRLLIKEEDGKIKPLGGKYIFCAGKDFGSMLQKTKDDGKFWCIGKESEYFVTLDRNYIRNGTYYFKYFATKVKVKSGEIKDLGDIIAYDFTNGTGIEGYVYSKETGKPIEGASITITRKVERVSGNFVKLDYIQTDTDKNGYFKATPLPEGEYKVTIDVLDYIEKKKNRELKYEEYDKYIMSIKKVKVVKGKKRKIIIKMKTE